MTQYKKSTPAHTPSFQRFPVVGIGASAGGLEAFKKLIHTIPADSGMAYVLVQHLARSHNSVLADILAKSTALPVHEITDEIVLTPNHLYVIPPNKTLTASDGVLKLTPRDKSELNNCIDIFFTSLAEIHLEFAIGIVLSGTGYDGTAGLKAIKAGGGITLAQDPKTAEYANMPQSAIDAGVADFILAPENMPGHIIHITGALQQMTADDEGEGRMKDEEIYKKILIVLRNRKGPDFSHYKQPTMLRRIARRVAISDQTDMANYLTFLRNNKLEQDALLNELLISVTFFFRDPKTFSHLTEYVFPEMVKNMEAGPIRVWVAGCSTGEEAYSLAICLHEFMEERSLGMPIQVFATDISENAIIIARKGIYKKEELADMAPARLQQYFVKTDGDFHVSKLIRDMVVFAKHNFLKDPPFAKMDFISCRNVLIYMDNFLQNKALTIFNYALNEKGFLLLGKAETTSAAADLYSHALGRDKIFSPRHNHRRFIPAIHMQREEPPALTTDSRLRLDRQPDFQKNANELLLAKYTPCGVVINEQLDIVHFHGATGRFFDPSPGKPSLNILHLINKSLVYDLRNIIHKVRKKRENYSKQNILFKGLEKDSFVNIEILPLLNTAEIYYMVLFLDSPQDLPKENIGALQKPSKVRRDMAQRRIQQLEVELEQTRDDIRSVTENQEAANEELQSTNEELLSSSEEMQSINEELETSKEELQSTNEELIATNEELVDKQQELNAALSYSENIISTLREPLLVLDKSLQIKFANLSFYHKFKVSEQETIGNALYDIGNGQWNIPELRTLLQNLLPEKQQINDFEVTHDFPIIGSHTLVLNARQILAGKGKEQMILLAIEDVTAQRDVTRKQFEYAQHLETRVRERTDDLMKLNWQLEQFAHVASHDMQEPLLKILAFISRIQSNNEPILPDTQKYVEKIQHSATQMQSIIQDLLKYAQLLNVESLFVQTDLNIVLKNILADFEMQLDETQAQIEIHPLPTISAIPLQMSQVLYNLLGNALKFSNNGSKPLIKITSRKLPKKEVLKFSSLKPQQFYYEILVEDNGIGFDQKYAERIFTIFQRLNDKSYVGNGIGLSIVRKVIENHHGLVYATSKKQGGAAFYIILPSKQQG